MSTLMYNGSLFWSFDTPALTRTNINDVKARSPGRALFWKFSGADAQGSLAEAIRSVAK